MPLQQIERKNMKRLLVLALATAVSASALYAADRAAKESERLDSAAAVIKELEKTPDKGIPDEIVSRAKCVAVVPSLKKGAIGIGGQYGQGFATCRTKAGGWSAPAPIRMAGGSWGLQLGGSSSDIVMVAVNDKGMQKLLESKFKIGADANASAGPVGRHAQAGTDWKLESELLTYSRSKGLFAGISLDGTDVSQNDDDTAALYGHLVPFRTILSGQTPAPAGAHEFVSAVSHYFNRAQASKSD
jgi:SH3 domain-containing YSC84-like protein 1